MSIQESAYKELPDFEVPALDVPTVLKREPIGSSDESLVVIGLPGGGNIGTAEYLSHTGIRCYFGVDPRVIKDLRERDE